jgi:Cd2+/Zn2+-exporting ATPase
MSCGEEVVVLKREIGTLVGEEARLSFDILNGKMTVAPGGTEISDRELLEAVARTGMQAEPWREGASSSAEARFVRPSVQTVLTGASGALSLAGFVLHAWEAGGIVSALGSEGIGLAHQVPAAARALYALGIILGGWHVAPKAWLAAKRLRPDMNLLMTVAVLGAVAIGEWFEAATVSFLFAVSLALESWSIGRARRAVAALMELAPLTARRLRPDGSTEEVAPESVPAGALFVVTPGDRVPLDGQVVKGSSDVNQAPITGESLPVPKHAGDKVFAGTINGDGALEVECTKAAGDTTLAHIIRMVGEAQSRRAPSERWVEKFARIYTPSVMALAVAVLLGPPLLVGAVWGDWFYRSLVLLVIGCPCALVISTPVSVVAALAAAARQGVLIKGGLHIETPARLKAVALDKTGTVTEGRLQVVEVVPLAGHDERGLLEIVAALEAHSKHPLAKAILAFAEARGIVVAPADEFRIIQGKGATARLRGRQYWLGSHRYLEERREETADLHHRLTAMSSAGRSVVIVGDESHVCGLIALADTVRPEATWAIAAMRLLGVKHVVLITGDNRDTAEAIARATGVDEVHAELLPADKVQVVEQLVARYGSVAMLGDGVNDAPAMARATLGIAMGAAGSDAAIETADVALMADDLAKVPWLIRHSRRALTIIRQNIALSLSVKAAFVALTFLGHASLWAAIAADMGTSLLVIFNGLRLLRS